MVRTQFHVSKIQKREDKREGEEPWLWDEGGSREELAEVRAGTHFLPSERKEKKETNFIIITTLPPRVFIISFPFSLKM